MELFILIAVVRWLSGVARTAGRSPFAWGIAGAVVYVAVIVAGLLFISLFMFIVGPLLSTLRGERFPLLGPVFVFAVMNAAGLGLANILSRAVFNKNLTTMKSLARIPNIGAIVFACLFLIPPLIGLFVMGHLEIEEVVKALPMAGTCLVLVVTLLVLRNNGEGVTIAVWPAFIVLSANVILAAALLWYSTTWALPPHPGTMLTISLAMFAWCTLAAGLNVYCVGLTIRSSRRLERRG